MPSRYRLWGRNIFTENGSEWSRHRRIMNPAFTPETSAILFFPGPSESYVISIRNALVWEEAASLYGEIMEAEGWMHANDMMIPSINDITAKVGC